MINTICNFFNELGVDLTPIQSKQNYNSVVYYFNMLDLSKINKIKTIINGLKIYLNNNNILYCFENEMLKIEIANKTNKIIYFENHFKNIPKNQNYIFLGVTNENEDKFEKIEKIKSLLIGGSSGSGKSNLLHQIILSILLNNDNIYLLTIDLKATELTQYDKLKNNRFIRKCATNQKEALRTIILFYTIIQKRFKSMKRKGERLSNENPIVLIIDEYAQLFNNNKEKKLINNYIAKIGAIGRACNCYLILATQHPTNENITNTIRANIQSRIALKCQNVQQSKNIINQTGAEKIQNAGDMILWIDGQMPQNLKSCLVSDNLLNQFKKVNS